MPQASLTNRLLTNSTAANASALTAGWYTKATLVAAMAGALASIIQMGPAGDGPKRRGAEVEFFSSAGNNNKQATCRVWRVMRASNKDNRDGTDPWVYQLELIGEVAIVLSLATGPGNGGPISATELVADTLTWTVKTDATSPKGIGDVIARAYGSPTTEAWPSAGAAAGDIPARLFIADAGGGDILLEPFVSGGGSASTDINAAWVSAT